MSDPRDKLVARSDPSTADDPRLRRPEAPPRLVRTARLVIWLGLALLFVALVWWGIARRLTWPPVILGAIGVGGVLVWLALNLRALRQTLGTRGAKLVLNSAGFVVLVLGILVLLNLIVVRHPLRHDFTSDKLYSLSSQSLGVINGLQQDVQLIAFTPQDNPGGANPRRVVSLYKDLSPRLRVQWADETDVALAKQYKVTFPGTVVVAAGERNENVTDVTEQRLTSALMSVTSTQKTKVYFLTGHGESGLTAGGETSVSKFKTDLSNQQYEVVELDLLKMAPPAVPADCDVLAIIGARVPLQPQEMAALQQYLDARGKLLLALAPLEKPNTPDFNELLSRHGVQALPGTVIDGQSGYMGDPTTLVVAPTAGGTSPVLEGVDRLILPLCRPLEVIAPPPDGMPPGSPPPGAPALALVSSSAVAFLQPDLTQPLKAPAGGGKTFALVAVVDETPPPPAAMPGMPPPSPQEEGEGTRVVVVGTSLAFDDTVASAFLRNGYLALNSVAWLTNNVRLISIPPKEEKPRRLLLTSTQKNFIIFVVVLFLPLAVIIGGISVWWTRRR